jgi:hypothetical protein
MHDLLLQKITPGSFIGSIIPHSKSHHHGIYTDILQNAAITVMHITTNTNDCCGQKVRKDELIFYVNLKIRLFQLSSPCRCWYLSPWTESGPASTSKLWPNTQLIRGHEPEVRKNEHPIFYLELMMYFFNWILVLWPCHASYLSPPTESVTAATVMPRLAMKASWRCERKVRKKLLPIFLHRHKQGIF